mmetsp:Transcript_11304/g.15501  ORF Transcript_11304/g.15501 Transcript_11304/m.15501 type:complete len:212 (+) Transcript_11304:854-1489(+)
MKLKIISGRICQVLGEDVRYITALLGALIIRLVSVLLSVYVLLWVTQFVDSGVLENEKEAAIVYSQLAMISVLLGLSFVPLSGYLADKISPRFLIPVAFLSRAIVVNSFVGLDRPDTFAAYFLCSFMMVTSLLEVVSIEVLYLKKMPGDIRGVMTSLFGLFGMLGVLIFTYVGSVIYESSGANGPFVVLGSCDMIIAIMVIVLGCCGKLKD